MDDTRIHVALDHTEARLDNDAYNGDDEDYEPRAALHVAVATESGPQVARLTYDEGVALHEDLGRVLDTWYVR